MRNKPICRVVGAVYLAAAVTSCAGEQTGNSSAALTGAIFTSTVDGDRVNQNIYEAKEDVYLDGGPGMNAPPGAAGLPEGDYYFQVTDPSGQTLLSTDDIECRGFHVNSDGLTDAVLPGPNGCEHATGTDDNDYPNLGAITVQLIPYNDTPNPGNVYKVWVTTVDDYNDNGGFDPNDSKTDNFRVVGEDEPYCGDGEENEANEECDDGNNEDGDGCSAECEEEDDEEPCPPPPCCGDGDKEGDEECDDGNNEDGDGCSSDCELECPPDPPVCGNGIIEIGEECDGNATLLHICIDCLLISVSI